MIRLRRGARPATLTRRGGPARRAMEAAFDGAPADYLGGARTFEFDPGLYGASAVKAALLAMQSGKCAFCEAKLAHVAYGDVEHFRPKAGWRQNEGDALQRPGYYWLAYEWTNLFLSCQLCNQRHEGNLFPLEAPADRAASHHDDCARERPLFIDPVVDDPPAHISFRAEVPHPVDGSARGRRTIDGLGLAREALNEHRREKLTPMQRLVELIAVAADTDDAALAALAERARATLRLATQDDAEYAGMIRALLAPHGLWP